MLKKEGQFDESLFIDTEMQDFADHLIQKDLQPKRNKTLFVVDGLGLLFKSFYATRELTNHRNENIAGIRGFILQLIKIQRVQNPNYMIVAFDSGKKTWRHLMDERYKSNRSKTPPELLHQFDWMREACNYMGIRYCEGEDCEADDWIASVARTHSKEADVYIVSADKDLCQLVDERVFIYDSFSSSTLKYKDVVKKFGVQPSQIADLLSLTGDSCDCIDGAKGIGPKTACRWLAEHSTLEAVLSSIDLLTPKSRAEMLKASMDKVRLAKVMVSLRSSLSVLPIDQLTIRPSILELKAFLERIGLQELMSRMGI